MTERLIIVDHVLFVVEDFPASRRLYTAALAPLGIEELNEEPNCISYGRLDLDDFSICEGSPVTTAAHVAFDAADRESVDALAGLFASSRLERWHIEDRSVGHFGFFREDHWPYWERVVQFLLDG